MNILTKLAQATEDFLAYVGKYMIGKDMVSYCDLETAIGLTDDDIKRNPDQRDPYILMTREGSLATVIDLQGTFEILSDHEFGELVDTLRMQLASMYSKPGHTISLGFERDPQRGFDELMRLTEPQINTARRMGLQAEDILLDRVKRNAPYVAYEQNLLVLYTHPVIMTDEELKRERKHLTKELVAHKVPKFEYGQNPVAILMNLKFRHDTMLDRIESDFQKCGSEGRAGIMLERLTAHEAIKRIRIMVNRERTSQKFRPVLPGDRFMPHGRPDKKDFSDLVPPPVAYQICTNDVESTVREIVRTDDLLHGNLYMELGPQEPKPFAKFFESIDRNMPWRMRLDLEPGGLDKLRGRRMASSFVAILPGNRSIHESFIALGKHSRAEPVCLMKVTFSTWAKEENDVKRRLATIEKAIQNWGVCAVTGVRGDPLGGWASTIPGMSVRNVADPMVPPLSDALTMMPLQRPATPWAAHGSLIQRTPDGKIFPIQLGSRLQDTSIELVAAPPGSGKSVMANTQHIAAIFDPGNVRLPLLTVIDVGPSSRGMIDLIRDSLPDDRKQEAVYIRLQNSRQFAVNVFDTQLGCRYPTVKEQEFGASFLAQMCVDTSESKIPGGVSAVCGELINIAYKDRATTSCLPYEPDVESLVDAALQEAGLRDKHDHAWWEAATWYEVTDLLYEAGRIREAALAQRQAVPVLPDFVSYLNHDTIKKRYAEARISSGEPLLAYMYRCFGSAISNYAVFAGRTRFELSSATRMISLDLNDVIGGMSAEGYARTTLMYMFAMQLATKNYFLSDDVLLPVTPPLYVDYHKRRIADVKEARKNLIMDELHNTGSAGEGSKELIGTLVKLGREGRKWGIRISLLSQYLYDFPKELLDAATMIYVMRGGTPGDEDVLRKYLKIGDEPIRRLRQDARGPGPEGGNYLAIFKTKVGNIVQILTNTVGPIEMWAFSTTPDDTSLRDRLYKTLGTYPARRLLAERFPLGTATRLIEVLKRESSAASTEVSVIETLANQLVEEYEQKVRELERAA